MISGSLNPESANQPAKVYPALIGWSGAARKSSVLVVVAGTSLPWFELKVTIRVFADQPANSSMLVLGVYSPEASPILVASGVSFESYQPVISYPARISVAGSCNFPEVTSLAELGITGPPLES